MWTCFNDVKFLPVFSAEIFAEISQRARQHESLWSWVLLKEKKNPQHCWFRRIAAHTCAWSREMEIKVTHTIVRIPAASFHHVIVMIVESRRWNRGCERLAVEAMNGRRSEVMTCEKPTILTASPTLLWVWDSEWRGVKRTQRTVWTVRSSSAYVSPERL